MTLSQIAELLREVKYKDWTFHLSGDYYLQVQFRADGEAWNGRKWRLSTFMTRSEIVQTALMAVLAAEEHEAREHFKYRGKAVFGPHIDVDKLYEVCEDLDVRPGVTPGAAA